MHVTALIGHGRTLDVQQRAGEQLFAALTEHLGPLYDRSPLAISLNIQEIHPVLNFKKNNLHEHVEEARRGEAAKRSEVMAAPAKGATLEGNVAKAEQARSAICAERRAALHRR